MLGLYEPMVVLLPLISEVPAAPMVGELPAGLREAPGASLKVPELTFVTPV